ncbi:MAG TPA: NTP transferase domain-containing protein [Gaiellaceae bacterium]|nr:NTP transferase domain-containing protein [Gaiellaceae bacterium]
MATVVIPFAGAEGKTRLQAARGVRNALALAMLADVVAACRPIGRTRVVTPDKELLEVAGVEIVSDPGEGQGAAVAAALAGVEGPVLVVNADVPCVVPEDLRALAEAAPALVTATDGTTNALSLPAAACFAPLYGAGSAARFRAHAGAVSVVLPNLVDDVDTMDDLWRLELRAGPRTRAALGQLERLAS